MKIMTLNPKKEEPHRMCKMHALSTLYLQIKLFDSPLLVFALLRPNLEKRTLPIPNLHVSTIFVFSSYGFSSSNPLKDLQIFQRNLSKGIVHMPKPNHQWNLFHKMVRNPCHKIKTFKEIINLANSN